MASKNRKKQYPPVKRDSTFVIKLVIYVILGMQWLWLFDANDNIKLMLPVGFMLGLFIARHEHFQIDRKLEYTVLVIATLIGFIFRFGLYFGFS